MSLLKGTHASTFGGNSISCTAASTVINVIKQEKPLEISLRLEGQAMKRLYETMKKYEIMGDVRGKELMIGVELVKDKRSQQ